MNQIIAQNAVQLPAHLQALAGKNSGNLTGGITVGANFHSIGIGQSRWRLYDPQGQEVVVQALHLDVIVLDANPHLSKRFYLKAYDKDAKPTAPDCFSDNGVGPSVRSAHPQCGTCAQCPNNVWGSRVLPNGKQAKACADSKNLAVILADNPTGPVYQLSVPPASLKNLHAFGTSLESRGIPMPSMAVRLTFDPSADFPLIIFTPSNWCSPEQVAAVMDVLESDEVNTVVNKSDRAIDPAKFTGAITHVRTAQDAPSALPPSAGVPFPSQPLGSGTPIPAIPGASQQPVQRKRRTKAEIAAEAAGQIAPVAAQPVATAPAPEGDSFFGKLQAQAAPKPSAQVVTNPQPTGAALDALLEQAFKV